MKTKLFEFNGDWEFQHQFEAFRGLQSRKGAYTSLDSNRESDGIVNVIIQDELDDETDPSTSQINAINYLIQNPVKIKNTLYHALKLEYPKLKEIYGYDDSDEEDRKWFPSISELDDFRTVFGVGNVFVMIAQKDDHAYIGLECGCTWDEEHGLGFLLHKDRLVNIGQAETGFDPWEAYKDNGTYDLLSKQWKNKNKALLPKPKIYQPNPKYGKLKPSQVAANNMYENHLIERGYNEEFIDLVQSGKIDININNGLSMTFLERAAQFNNLEIVKFILSKKPKSKKNTLQYAIPQCNKELVNILIEHGININAPNWQGKTILSLTEQQIEYLKKTDNDSLAKYQAFADWLKSKGAQNQPVSSFDQPNTTKAGQPTRLKRWLRGVFGGQ